MSGRKQFEPHVALDAAVRVFWEKGYGGASVADLLAATRLSRASLYATFGDKQHLFLTCLARYMETVGGASRAVLVADRREVRSRIEAGFSAILDRMADPSVPSGCLLAQTAAECGSLDPPIRIEVHRLVRDQITQLAQLLCEDSSTSGAEVDCLAAYLVTMSQALAVMHRAGTDVETLRLTVRLAMRVFDATRP